MWSFAVVLLSILWYATFVGGPVPYEKTLDREEERAEPSSGARRLTQLQVSRRQGAGAYDSSPA